MVKSSVKDYDWSVVRRGGKYYCRFKDKKTSRVICEKTVSSLASQMGIEFDGSIGGRTKDKQAERICLLYYQKTREHKAKTPTVLEYCRSYWDFKGERVTLSNKKNPNSVAESSCYTNLNNFNNHIADYFPDNPMISEISSRRLNEIQDDLLTKGELANATIEKIMRSITTPLNDAFDHGITDNGVRVDSLDTSGKEKGIMTDSQIASVVKELYRMSSSGRFRHRGANEGIACAALTAMRMGEVRALRKDQIEVVDDTSIIHITRTWSNHGGDKIPKGKRTRQVTIPTVVAKALIALADKDIWGNGRCFWITESPDSVRSATFFRNNLYEAMKNAGISEDQRRTKNITFHSLRHGYISYIRHQVSNSTMRLAVGHKDKETTDKYTHLNYDNLKELGESTEKTFKEVLSAETTIIGNA